MKQKKKKEKRDDSSGMVDKKSNILKFNKDYANAKALINQIHYNSLQTPW